MRDGRAADLPGAVLRRPLAGPRRLPAPGRGPVGARRPRLRGARHQARAAGQAAASSTSSASTTGCSREVQGVEPAVRLRGPRRRTRSSRSSSRRYAALHRHVVRQLEARRRGDPARDLPRAGRALRDLRARLRVPRRGCVADDHLSLVAGARRDQRERLVDLGLADGRARWPARPSDLDPAPLGAERFDVLRHQAALQVESRDDRRADATATCQPARGGGLRAASRRRARATSSSTSRAIPTSARRRHRVPLGLVDRRGAATSASGRTTPTPRRRRFERFVDRVVELRARAPGHARLPLRAARARPSCARCRSSTPRARTRSTTCCATTCSSTSTRSCARACRSARRATRSRSSSATTASCAWRRRVREGGGSIVAYETWLETGDDELLEAIRAYNEEDCRSTLSLRDWLLDDMRPEAAARVRRRLRRPPRARARGGRTARRRGCRTSMALDRAADRRAAGGPATTTRRPGRAAPARAPAALPPARGQAGRGGATSTCADKTLVELIDERDALGGLVRDARAGRRSRTSARSTTPSRSRRRSSGSTSAMPTTRRPARAHTLVAVEDDHVVLRRGNDAAAARPGGARRRHEPIDGAVAARGARGARRRRCSHGDGPLRRRARAPSPRAAAAALGRARRGRRRARSRPTLGLDRLQPPGPGPARHRQDLPRRAHGRRGARRPGVRVGDHRAQPRRDPEPPARRRGAARTRRASSFAGIYKGEGYDEPPRPRRAVPTTTTT